MGKVSSSAFVVVSLIVLGCSRPANPNNETYELVEPPVTVTALDSPPELLSGTEPGFADLVFYIESFSESDTAFIIEATALDKGEPVALRFDFPKEWLKSQLGGTLSNAFFYDGSVILKPVDSRSDRLLVAINNAYGLNSPVGSFPKEVYGLAVGLDNDPSTIATAPCRIKCFLETDGAEQSSYAEFILVVDVPDKVLMLQEKDISYRKSIVEFFNGRSVTSYRDPAEFPTEVQRLTSPPE